MCVNNSNCNCDNAGMSLSKYKGEKGDPGMTGAKGDPGLTGAPGLNGINGTNGIDGASMYLAWSSSDMGDDFTLTPTDSLYLGVTDTISGITPVPSDFTGKYFRINQPVKEYKTSRFSGESYETTSPGTTELLPSPIALGTISDEFINTLNSFIEIDFNWISFPTGIAGQCTVHSIIIDINGHELTLGVIDHTEIDTVQMHSKITLIATSTTSMRGMGTTNISGNSTGSGSILTTSSFGELLPPINSTSGIDVSITKVYTNGNTALTFVVHDIIVKAYNPNKTTM